MGRRKVLALAAPAIAMALVVSACGGGGGGELKSPDQQKVGANDINPQPASDIKDGGTLQWPLDDMPDNWNQYQVDGTTNDGQRCQNTVMPWLFTEAPDSSVNIDHDYLVSAEVVSTSPQVIEYKINPKAKWSTGRAFSWEDFQTQWQALNGSNTAYQTAEPAGYDHIAKVERGGDDQDVKVSFSQPFGEWKSLFSPLYPKEVMSDPTEFNSGWANEPKITSGPFKVGKIDLTAKTVRVVRDPSWWGERPHLDAILFKQLTRSTLPDAMASGAIDVADTNAALDAVTRYRNMPGVTLHEAVAPDNGHLTLNGGAGRILADQKLRQVLFEAVDRTAIANAEFSKITSNPVVLRNHFYAYGSKQYQDNSGGLKFDLDKAKKDLDALGWKQNGQFRTKDGKELDLTYIGSSVQTSDDVGKLLEPQFAAAGVKLIINRVPTADFFKKYINVGNFDISYYRWLATSFPLSGSTSIYKLNLQNPADIGQNYGHVGNQRINDLLDQANTELEDAKRTELTQQADKAVWDAAGELPLFQLPSAVATKKNIANYGAMGFATNPIDYAKIGFTKS